MIKATDEQPGEEEHKARSGRVPGIGASGFFSGVGVLHPSQHVDILPNPEALQTLNFSGFPEAS